MPCCCLAPSTVTRRRPTGSASRKPRAPNGWDYPISLPDSRRVSRNEASRWAGAARAWRPSVRRTAAVRFWLGATIPVIHENGPLPPIRQRRSRLSGILPTGYATSLVVTVASAEFAIGSGRKETQSLTTGCVWKKTDTSRQNYRATSRAHSDYFNTWVTPSSGRTSSFGPMIPLPATCPVPTRPSPGCRSCDGSGPVPFEVWARFLAFGLSDARRKSDSPEGHARGRAGQIGTQARCPPRGRASLGGARRNAEVGTAECQTVVDLIASFGSQRFYGCQQGHARNFFMLGRSEAQVQRYGVIGARWSGSDRSSPESDGVR